MNKQYNEPQLTIEEQELKNQISTLKTGQLFSNYQELCKTIKIEPVSGYQKKKQIKELERYMDFVQIKGTQRIRIKKIYKHIKPTEPPENAVYISTIQLTLLKYMQAIETGNKISLTINKLMNNIGIVNDNWNYGKREGIIKQIEKQKLMPIEEVKEWQLITSMTLKQLMNRAMEDMKKRYIIDYDVHTKIITSCIDIETGEEKLLFRIATEEERTNLLKIKREVMLKMGYKHSDNIPYLRLGEFYHRVENEYKHIKIISNNKSYQIIGMYEEFDIYFNKEFLHGELEEIQQEYEDNRELLKISLQEEKNKLNTKIVNKLLQASESKKHNNTKIVTEQIIINKNDRSGFGNRNNKNLIKLSDNYINNCKELIDLFIDLKGSLYNFLKGRGYNENEINQIIELCEQE